MGRLLEILNKLDHLVFGKHSDERINRLRGIDQGITGSVPASGGRWGVAELTFPCCMAITVGMADTCAGVAIRDA
jgi:hypothetical protein